MSLTNAGRNIIPRSLIENPGVVHFNALTSHLGFGNNLPVVAFAVAQTDLQGTLKWRKQMDLGFPQMLGQNVAVCRSTLLGGEVPFQMAEWGWFNAAIGGTMMNRKVEAIGAGAKPFGQVWTVTASMIFTNI